MGKCSSHPSPRKYLFAVITEIYNWSICREQLILRSPAPTDTTTASGIMNACTTKEEQFCFGRRASMYCIRKYHTACIAHSNWFLHSPMRSAFLSGEHYKTPLCRESNCTSSAWASRHRVCAALRPPIQSTVQAGA